MTDLEREMLMTEMAARAERARAEADAWRGARSCSRAHVDGVAEGWEKALQALWDALGAAR